jgi:hypothetical protein
MTAVEFLLRQFALLGYDVHKYETIINEVKEMEKEQKETYKYTEEDLRKAIELAKEGNYQRDWVGGIQVTDKYDKDEIIKVINQSKQQEQ